MSIQTVQKQWAKLVAMILLLCIMSLCLSGCSLFDGQKYDKAVSLYQSGKYDEAITVFSEIEQYEDSSTFIMYIKTLQLAESGEYALAASTFDTMGSFRDSKYLSVYYSARQAEEDQRYEDADAMYRTIVTFSDSSARLNALPDLILQRDFASAASGLSDGSYDEKDQAAFADLATKQYSDSETRMKQDIYDLADGFLTDGNYGMAYALFYLLDEHTYSDSAIRMKDCRFAYVQELMELGEYQGAYDHIQEYLLDYEPATDTLKALPDLILKSNFDAAAEGLYDGEYSKVDAKAFVGFVTQVYSDSDTRMYEEIYAHADALLADGEYGIALELFVLLEEQEYSDSSLRVQDCRYAHVENLMDKKQYAEAYSYIDTYLVDYPTATESRKECSYNLAENSYANNEYAAAYAYYQEAGDYSDATDKAAGIDGAYQAATKLLNDGEYEQAHAAFSALYDYSDSPDRVLESYYLYADKLYAEGDYEQAYSAFLTLGDYSDAVQRSEVVKLALVGWYIDAFRFDDALALLNTMPESQEKTALQTECRYAWAIYYYNNKDFKNAFYTFIELGDYKETHSYVENICANEPEPVYELGMTYYNWGNYEIARKCFAEIESYSDVSTLLYYCQMMLEYQGTYKDPWLKSYCASYKVLIGNKVFDYDLDDDSFSSSTVCLVDLKGELALISEYDYDDYLAGDWSLSCDYLTVDDNEKALGVVYFGKKKDMALFGQYPYYTIDELNEEVRRSREVPEPYVGMSADDALQSIWGTPKSVEKTVYAWGVCEKWTCAGKYYSDRYIYLENGIVVGCED